ncbi:MAG: IS701 family transposase [Planctomycetota bacterium]
MVHGWSDRLDELLTRIGEHFSRRDLRGRAWGYVRGLLGGVERKNGWQLAEHAGHATPDGLQRLLGPAKWDADAVRDEVQRYAAEHLLAHGPRSPGGGGGVLIVDETGFLKKGTKSCGVQRQYSGTAGRIENCQVGVFLALSGPGGRCLIDRELYLPKAWCEDTARRREAHVPDEMAFATKPQLARRMLRRALDAPGGGLEPEWVLGDEVYSDYETRRFLESRGRAYVLAVSAGQRLWVGFEQQKVSRIADDLEEDRWWSWSVGEGAKGPRVYRWAAARFGVPTDTGMSRWLLIRRPLDRDEAGDRAYYLCAAHPGASPQDLATAAGKRWAIETCFQTAKQETGLDEYEVRTWHGWHRHVTLSMLALAFLAAVRAEAEPPNCGKKGSLTWCR